MQHSSAQGAARLSGIAQIQYQTKIVWRRLL